jgi:class 3 adenylate cyclase
MTARASSMPTTVARRNARVRDKTVPQFGPRAADEACADPTPRPRLPVMTLICPACGAENPERARFCNACAAPLVDAWEPREERKIVSVLFVDLVGFIGRSDNADPEDMRAVLRPYHARMQQEIERFGGTVEKFVGDAVMAVFGAPAAHEDDAERAVRAALRILESIDELNESMPGLKLAVRAAVNTGEAVVSLAARAERGESIATGDVVNTAARLQGAAPTGGVVVGESTYRATRQAVEYADAEPVTVKGKASPLRIWHAVGARCRLGVDLERAERKPFVVSDDDLALLTSTFVRATRERSAQLVTVTGEPGVGKTRLVTELRRFVGDRPELVTWRQGRCLPYGDGITYWALGEIVKAHAGILESDSADEVTAKLERALGAIASDVPERDWLQAQLAPLVGLVASEDGSRDEAFTAWRRFLEGIASDRPAVLVFEDLHWADAALVDFIEQLVDRSSDVSLLVVCSGRPELYERHPSWGGGKRNSTTISLAPLTPTATSELLAALLRQAVLPAETQTALLERCGGNPLYAEEFRPHAHRPRRPQRARGDHGRHGNPAPGERPGVDRRADRHSAARTKGAPPQRGRDREGVLAGGGRGDGRRRSRRRARRLARPRPQGARTAGALLLRPGRDRVLVLARPRPRRGIRADPAGGAGTQTRGRGTLDRAHGGHESRRPRRAPRVSLRAGARADARCA